VQSLLYEVAVLHNVRGETCSLPCMRLLFCTMSEGRRVISSAQGMIVLSPHASEEDVQSLTQGRRGNASAVHWDLFLCQI